MSALLLNRRKITFKLNSMSPNLVFRRCDLSWVSVARPLRILFIIHLPPLLPFKQTQLAYIHVCCSGSAGNADDDEKTAVEEEAEDDRESIFSDLQVPRGLVHARCTSPVASCHFTLDITQSIVHKRLTSMVAPYLLLSFCPRVLWKPQGGKSGPR